MNSDNDNPNKKSKNQWNPKYTLIAVYSFIVILSSFAVILIIWDVRDFFINREYTKILNILTPIIYGFILAYLLNPLCMFFQNKIFFKLRKKSKNIFSILATYLTMIIIITLILLMVIPQVISSVQQLTGIATDWFTPVSYGYSSESESGDFSEGSEYDEEKKIENSKIVVYLHDLGADIQDYVDKMGLKINVEEIFDGMAQNVISLIYEYISPAINYTVAIIYATASELLNVFLGLLLSIYLLSGKDKFIAQTKKLLFAVCPAGFSYKLVRVMRKTHEIFGGFITGKIVESAIVGVICFIVMSVFNLSYSTLISVIVAVANVIPFFGALIGGVIGVMFLAINDIGEAALFVVIILVLEQIDGNFIGPKILGPKVGMPAFWVIVSILVMNGLFGLPGFFIGVPVFAVAYVLIKEFAENRLAAKGFPAETEQYVRNYGNIESGNAKKTRKEKESGFIFIGKTLNKIAKNITVGFGSGKKTKKVEKDSSDNDNNSEK